jgi:hypothetical protein
MEESVKWPGMGAMPRRLTRNVRFVGFEAASMAAVPAPANGEAMAAAKMITMRRILSFTCGMWSVRSSR